MKILVVDDSRFFRLASERALTKAGHSVISAMDGEQGLQLAKEKSPDLIFLDMMLPKVPGVEVLRILKQDESTKKIPVIVLTSLSERNREKLIQEGAAGFVEKSEKILDHDGAALRQAISQVAR